MLFLAAFAANPVAAAAVIPQNIVLQSEAADPKHADAALPLFAGLHPEVQTAARGPIGTIMGVHGATPKPGSTLVPQPVAAKTFVASAPVNEGPVRNVNLKALRQFKPGGLTPG